MENNIYDKMQNRASVTQKIRDFMDAHTGVLNGEDQATLANMEKEFDDLNATISAMQRQQERERQMANPEPERPKATQVEAFRNALCSAAAEAQYRNDYTLGTDATAGYLTAPTQFVADVISGVDDLTFMRKISHITPRLGNAQSLGFPYVETDASDAEWLAEAAEPTLESTLAYGMREFKPNRMGKEFAVSRLLLNHSAIAEAEIKRRISTKLGVTMEKAYMTGDGTGKPLGIFTASASGISTARDIASGSTTGITSDAVLDMRYGLKQQYIPKAKWVMHRNIVKAVAKLKDSNNQYLWQPSLIADQPDRLAGMSVYMSEFAPGTISSGNYGAVLGDFDYYWIADCDRLEMQILREKYASKYQVGYLFNYFGDGAPVVGDAFVRLKFAAS